MNDTPTLKETLAKFKKESFVVRSWEDYNKELNNLLTRVADYVEREKVTIDAVVPILRGGNIPATYIAYKLDVLTILPVQYKYFFKEDTCELRRLRSLDTSKIHRKDPTFILVEGNHCYGNQARHAASDIRKTFPECTIIYTASNMDYNYQDVVQDADVSFHGRLTNACKELSDDECKKLNIYSDKVRLFPWEHIEEEWDIIKLRQRKYQDLSQNVENSPIVQEFDLTS